MKVYFNVQYVEKCYPAPGGGIFLIVSIHYYNSWKKIPITCNFNTLSIKTQFPLWSTIQHPKVGCHSPELVFSYMSSFKPTPSTRSAAKALAAKCMETVDKSVERRAISIHSVGSLIPLVGPSLHLCGVISPMHLCQSRSVVSSYTIYTAFPKYPTAVVYI